MTTPAGKNEVRRRRSKLAAMGSAGAVALGGLALTLASAGPAAGYGWEARAVLRDAAGVRVGTVRFEGDARGTTVKVSVRGITTGLDTYHGLHVHANDAREACAAPAFTNVGGHWNPSQASHGHHHGDLPSLLIQADGTGRATSVTGRLDPRLLAGRAVILHAGPDNFANIPDRYTSGNPPAAGPDATSKGTGDAGGRIACGIIQRD
jgi:Cu-Zn family superoxide dismutase